MQIAKENLLKIFSISLGFSISFLILEIYARIAPATDIFPIEKPIICNTNDNISLSCLHRRKARQKGYWSAGKFKPYNEVAFKETNDIGQFSDVDFQTFVKAGNNNLKVLTIGDSFVQAIEVKNSSTFHGLLNNFKTINDRSIISTAIGSAGMAFPNYITSIKYAKSSTDLNNLVLIIPIIANDFDESFFRFAQKGRRGGLGQFYFKEDSEDLRFVSFPDETNFTQKLINLTLRNSALSRYLIYNLKIGGYLKTNFEFLTSRNTKKVKFAANIIETSKDETPERYRLGELAIDKFIYNLKNLRKSYKDREKTFLVLDADRESIYKNIPLDKKSFYQTMRRKFIDVAMQNGFQVIDMKPIFKKDYSEKKLKFNSEYDGHWNEYGHKKISEEVINKINKLRL